MRFLFVVSGKDVPSTRFRILPYLPLLEAAGHTCDVAYSFPQKYDELPIIGWRLSQALKRTVRHWHVFAASRKKYDTIVIEREVYDNDSSVIEEKLRKFTSRLVLDVDDGVFLLYPEKFDRVARLCDAAISGNRWITDYVSPLCPVVEQIPTCVKLSDYTLSPTQKHSTQPCIGWIGTTHNVAFLKVAAAGLRTAAHEIPFKLLVIAPSDEKLAEIDLSGIEIDFRTWSPKMEVDAIREMDIGLMPLPTGEEWMKYKCGLKLIQYLSLGIPGISTPIGINAEILDGNRVGRAATNDHDWEEAILELLRNPSLRQQLGTAGRQLVESEYSIEGNLARFEQVLTGDT
ncbi:MAG: glycosyltransferase family 4 protein [Aureliella sp.]